MVTTHPPKTIVKPTAFGPVANTDTKLLIYGLFQKGRVLAQDGVEKKIRRHLARARLRQGFGWKRWSRRWMYGTVGLFTDYRVRYLVDWPKDAPAR